METIWSKQAKFQLQKLERTIAKRIYKKVEELSINPFRFVRKLAGSEEFKARVGDYRIILDISGDKIEILKVGHRSKIYKRL